MSDVLHVGAPLCRGMDVGVEEQHERAVCNASISADPQIAMRARCGSERRTTHEGGGNA